MEEQQEEGVEEQKEEGRGSERDAKGSNGRVAASGGV